MQLWRPCLPRRVPCCLWEVPLKGGVCASSSSFLSTSWHMRLFPSDSRECGTTMKASGWDRREGMIGCADCHPKAKSSGSISRCEHGWRRAKINRHGAAVVELLFAVGPWRIKAEKLGESGQRSLSRRFTLKRTTWLQPWLKHLKRAPLIIKPRVN